MNPDHSETADDSLTDHLAAYDEALAQGQNPDPLPDEAFPPELRAQLHGARDCLRRLEEERQRFHAWADGLAPGLFNVGVLPDPAGSQVGRFRIVRELGRGGHGVVYLAYDPMLEREVALKVPRPEVLVTPDLRRRFLAEARTAAGLSHPILVPVFEAGEVGPVCYIVSAFCPGVTLAAWLRQQDGPVPARTAAGLIALLADAAHYIHGHGVFHRDIKPGNILLEPKPVPGSPAGAGPVPELGVTPRLTDFGLARLDGGQGTRSGTVLGSPVYMAPEQVAGKPQDIGPGTDVYALGVVLFEMLTGQPPFRGATDWGTLNLIVTTPAPSPRTLRPDMPRDLETICLKCLEKEPSRRYPSAAALADDLRRFLAAEHIAARPALPWSRPLRWLRGRPAAWAVVAAAVAGLAGLWLGAAGFLSRATGPRPDVGVPDQPAAPQQSLFAPAFHIKVGTSPSAVAVEDFDGNGVPDLAVANGFSLTVSVLLGKGDGTFLAKQDYDVGIAPMDVGVGVFNADGKQDLVSANSDGRCISVLPGNGDGTFGAAVHTDAGQPLLSVVVGDFDGDGKRDVAAGTSSGTLAVFLGNGNRTFRKGGTYPAGLAQGRAVVVDWNGDGLPDLAMADGPSSSAVVLLSKAGRFFQTEHRVRAGRDPNSVGVGDFNGDGKPDLVVANFRTNDVSLLLGNGDGTFQPARHSPAGPTPYGLVVADFDGDGRLDVAVANEVDHTVSVLPGDGAGGFLDRLVFPVGLWPAALAVGDFNRDGRPDLAVANTRSHTVSILLNQAGK